VSDWLGTLWSWLRENKEVITIISAILGSIAALLGILTYAAKVRSSRRAASRQTQVELEPLPLEWPSGLIARSVAVEVLRGGFPVAPRTRLVVIDQGVRQFSRDPGSCTPAEARQLLEKHGVTKGAHGLQYITVPVEMKLSVTGGTSCDGFNDVETLISLWAKVDDETAERLMEWHLNRDGKVEESEIAKTLTGAIASWLLPQIQACEFEQLPEVFREKRGAAQQVLETELANHGLVVSVRDIQFSSAQHRALQAGVESKFQSWLAEEEERLRQRNRKG